MKETYQKISLKLKSLKEKDIEKLLFIFSMFFYIIIGIMLVYNFDFTSNYNLLFDSDTRRVIGDATEISRSHNRLLVHPLFVMLVQPVVFLLQGIVLNRMLALIIISALVSSISTVYIYKILNLFTKNKKTNLILTLIYIFSFSNYIYTAGTEIYNLATLFLIILWYYLIKTMKEKVFTKYTYIIFTILGALTFAFTITNYVVFLIAIFVLLISKKQKLKNLVGIVLASILLSIGLNYAQNLIWHNTPLIWKLNVSAEKSSYSNNKIELRNIENVLTQDYSNSIIASDISLKILYGNNYKGDNYMINFNDISLFNIIVLSIFYILLVIVLIRNFKKNIFLNIGLILTILFNSLLHVVYGNEGAFLYSLHFLYLIILTFGINLSAEEKPKVKKVCNLYLIFIIIVQLIINNYIFIKLLKIVKGILKSNFLVASIGIKRTLLIELILTTIVFIGIYIFIRVLKKLNKTKNKELKILKVTALFCTILAIQYVFIALETIPDQKKILWKDLPPATYTASPMDKLNTLSKSFTKYYQKEISSLSTYVNEYNEFMANYDIEKMGYANWNDYYFFGLGNRRKLMYKKNCLIDVETKKELFTFQEKEHVIVPNLYAVLIETQDGDYIKIYEDNEGVHYKINKEDKIISKTNINIDLYNFKNQKYQNIKKTLYGEILFNIKNNKIYPNVIVYDKPWYRDAAIACMVLKQTNNTDLIKEWTENIEEIYDKQNAGIEEPDNLGELLYILSTQENINEDLVDRIEEEAEKIANNNEKGYYLNGKTDFGEMNLYQNLWYKLGIESVGREFSFDLDTIEEDSYTAMAWWSDYKIDKETAMEGSKNYPYLSFATRHKLGKGKIAINDSYYPLSWEKNASQADYDKLDNLNNSLKNGKLSPTHTWAAAEMLLFLMDETDDLKFR